MTRVSEDNAHAAREVPYRHFVWGHPAFELTFEVDREGRLVFRKLAVGPDEAAESIGYAGPAVALVDVLTTSCGSAWSGGRLIDSTMGRRLRYVNHAVGRTDDVHALDIELVDPATGLSLVWHAESLEATSTARVNVTLNNRGRKPQNIVGLTSVVLPMSLDPAEEEVWWVDNDWLAEHRWKRQAARPNILPNLVRAAHQHDARGCLEVSTRGTWSTCGHQPVGLLTHMFSGRALAWEIEATSPWTWQVGEIECGLYFAAAGPDDARHRWNISLEPGSRFESAPVSLALSPASWDHAIALLTEQRRRSRRPHPVFSGPPVVFNDYMNALMGDPTEDTLAPMIAAAGRVGADVFCIDAGWFAETESWWDGVGEWEPSARRFPSGFHATIDRIRQAGMTPGLWLEPEVVGIRSPVAAALPDEAFFMRKGQRVVEAGRYHLDLTHLEARAHLDRVVDRLIERFGIQYFKLDYNISVPLGSDTGGRAPGQAVAEAGAAVARWHRGLLERHPDLVLENCGSGGMRADAAIRQATQLQSITDQQDPIALLPISVAAGAAIPIEQISMWCYPEPGWSEDLLRFALAGPLLGRFHLSGPIDTLTEDQLETVAAAIRIHKQDRHELEAATSVWPLGLPGWDDEWLSVGYVHTRRTRLGIWRRPRAGSGRDTITMRLPSLAGHDCTPVPVLDTMPEDVARFDSLTGTLDVTLPRSPSVVVLDFLTSDRRS